MKRKACRMAAAAIAAVIFFSNAASAAPSVSAAHAILMDAATGRVLWEKGSKEHTLIASTTKIMTGLLIAQDCNMESEVRVPADAVGVEGSSLYLKEGEYRTVEELLYGMMLHSGNDAAVTLAMYHSGTVESFVEKMNRKAGELSLSDTHFENPHGLDGSAHYASAYDLAVLTAHAMENPVFHQVVSTKTASFEGRTYTNHNKLLWQYDGAVGVKTGYTRAAGRILVSCAERDGRRLVAVTINAPNDWQDHKRLLDYGFAYYQSKTLVEAGEVLARVSVPGGGENWAEAVAAESFLYPVAEEEKVTRYCRLPLFVYPPVLAGDYAGELDIYMDSMKVASIPLYWRYTVLEGA